MTQAPPAKNCAHSVRIDGQCGLLPWIPHQPLQGDSRDTGGAWRRRVPSLRPNRWSARSVHRGLHSCRSANGARCSGATTPSLPNISEPSLHCVCPPRKRETTVELLKAQRESAASAVKEFLIQEAQFGSDEPELPRKRRKPVRFLDESEDDSEN